MSRYSKFPKYVSVAEKKEKIEKQIKKLKKLKPDITPVIITGRKLAKTWWGESWNENLERYSDYSNRIGRGSSYVKHGAVVDLKIEKGNITALVLGSDSLPYVIKIDIKPLSKTVWENIKKECEGKIDSLQEIVNGKFPKALSDMFKVKSKGLFPTPKEIDLYCDCPDNAKMCKHIAATLYGVGARLDENPKLFFELRDVNIEDLISKSISTQSEKLLKKSDKKSKRIIDDTDVLDLFGIDVDIDE